MSKHQYAINPSIAARIKARRRELGITQEKLAEFVERCEQTIRLYENCRLGVSPEMLRILAAELRTTADWLENGDT